MRILIFNWRDIKHEWAGGGEIYVQELAKRWVSMGHSVTLFCGQDVNQVLPFEEDIDGIHVIRKGSRFSVYFWAFWYYITRLRYTADVLVDVQNGIPFFTIIYSRKPKIAVVYHIHGKQFFIELPAPYSFIGYIIERYLFPLLYSRTQIQVISRTTKDDLVSLGIKEKNIHIVYCGVNGKVNLPITKHQKFSTPTLLYLGRIKKYKRVDMLVRLLPQIIQYVPTAQLIIAGWGTEASSVTDSSMRSGLRKRIRILGPVTETEKRNLLQKSWVFINPSINEGWGISVIEANLHGTPAVAFRVRGLSESIKDGKTGVLVDSEKGLIDAVIKLLMDEKLRNTLRTNAQKWASTFSWDKASQDSMKLIKHIANLS